MRALNKDPLAWGRYVAVAGAYAASYELTRNFSFSHWMLPAGLRLACLLLVPRRLWPALAVGEFLPIAEMAALHAAAFGTLWAILNSVPPILVCMPAVMWVQRRASLLRPDGKINMGMILTTTLLCSVSVAVENTVAFVNLKMGDGSPAPEMDLQLFLSWLLGCYLGALALTPTIVAMRERLARNRNEVDWRAILRSPLTRDSLYIAAPILAGLMFLSSVVEGVPLQVVRMSMALPVIVLTFRHGWHGSAIAGLLASVALASTSFQMEDPSMIRAQVVLAFAISTSLLFGVRVARRIAASDALHVQGPSTSGHLR